MVGVIRRTICTDVLSRGVLIGLLWLGTAAGQTEQIRKKAEQTFAAEPPKAYEREVEFGLFYDFTVPGQTASIKLVVLIPKTIPGRQQISAISYSPSPSRIISENGNRYAEFVLANPAKEFRVEVNVKARLFQYDLLTARRGQQKEAAEQAVLGEFLRHEQYVEKDDSAIRQVAQGITGQDDVETVRKIYQYVADNMEYESVSEEDSGALKALKSKKGDCSEYSDLFVALCRSKNIPAKFVTGYTMRFDAISPKHHWAEVYLQKFGWVPFEPSWGDQPIASARSTAFEKMQPIYVYLSEIRNDKVLFNKHFYAYLFWGDQVEVKDSIKFRRPTQFGE